MDLEGDNRPFGFYWRNDHEPPTWARHLAQHLFRRLELIMSSISDLAAVADAVAAAVARVDADLQALKSAVGSVTSLTPEDQATLDAAVANLQSSVDAVNAADPPPAP